MTHAPQHAPREPAQEPEQEPEQAPEQAAAPNAPSRAPRSLAMRLAPLGLVALAFVALWQSGFASQLSFANLLESREALAARIAANLPLALATFSALYIAVVALSIPGASIMTLAGGFLFGGWLGGTVNALSAAAGATLIFLIARSSLGDVLERRAGPWLARLRDGFREDAASYMLFLRLTPVFPFWLVNLAPAFLGVPLKTFAWTTLAGVVPATFAYSFAGAGLDSVARAQQEAFRQCQAAAGASGGANCRIEISPGSLVTRELLIGLAAIGVASLIPVVMKKWRARQHTRAEKTSRKT